MGQPAAPDTADAVDIAHVEPVAIAVGAEVTATYAFTDGNIRAYAQMAADTNPLHHDAAFAETSRFGSLIACAAHSTGVFTSLTAAAFSNAGQSVGLEFTHTLRRAVRTGTRARMTWRVVSVEPSAKLGGDIFEVEGAMTDEDDRPLVVSRGRLLRLRPGGEGERGPHVGTHGENTRRPQRRT